MFSRITKFFNEFKEIKYLAYHDALTGLYNRHFLYKKVEINKYKYIYFIDLNNLKEINKRGHSFGDAYIKRNIFQIKHLINNDDIFCRYAGDEFIVLSNFNDLLYNTRYYTVGCAKVADSLTRAINEADINMMKQKLYNNEKAN